ncbi:hypothetical protein L596_013182 [Steinernema carpocapsae]|uniref:BTB domain-containing protein n=1 Tax=Steinernema carpocapsae TaxID=34508 RepID=A0A4U5P019_STECR|nr:hypothetical protein L596_013182 [Steinernema carpocapsae]
MTIKGTLRFSTDSKDVIDIGDFKWFTKSVGYYSPKSRMMQFRADISCQPKEESRTALWSCSAAGTLAMANDAKNKQFVYHLWTASFSNGCTRFKAFYNNSKYENNFNAMERLSGKSQTSTDVHVKIVDSFYADLKDPKNALIEDPSDSALFKVNGEDLWLPKKVLAANSHFFAVLFRGNFKEAVDGFYEIKDLKLEEFIHFIGIVHLHNKHVDGKSVEGLLKLGDMYQCKIVLQRCEEYLQRASENEFPPMKKLFLIDTYKLHSILTDVLDQISVEELKAVPFDSLSFDVLRDLIVEKLRCIY